MTRSIFLISAVCALLLSFAVPFPAAGAAEKGGLEVAVAVEGGGSVDSLDLTLRGRTVTLEKGRKKHLFEDVLPGLYAVTGEAFEGADRSPSSRLLLGVAGVEVAPGKVASAELVLRRVDDAGRFCSGCHPAPGDSAGKGQIVRDVHASGGTLGGPYLARIEKYNEKVLLNRKKGDPFPGLIGLEEQVVDRKGKKIKEMVYGCETCHTAHRETPYTSYTIAPFREGSDMCLGCHGAGHAGQSAGVEDCYHCHTLDAGEVEKGTSHISAASRTLPAMKSLAKGGAPASFGCTYCHSNDLNRDRMKGVLTQFGSQTSKHPVGVDFTAAVETQGEYLSTWDSDTARELDCIDCHDPALLVDQGADNLAGPAPYANHLSPLDPGRAGNPFMLRESDMGAFCRRCHGKGETFAKADAAVTSHDDTTLVEDDGTPLKTSLCTDCHSGHSSSNFKLFRDGRQGGTAIAVSDDKHCSTVCHFRGDADAGFDLGGHGKAVSGRNGIPMRFGCGSCHNVDPRHDGILPKMLNFQEGSGTSLYGKSSTSVCYVCHSAYSPHGGEKGPAGCLDCHDEHAERSAPGGKMISLNVPNGHAGAEPNSYAKQGVDFYRADGKGFCDNGTCHAGVTAPDGKAVVPLSGFMKGNRHSGGDREPGSDCRECHSHTSRPGSWLAGQGGK
jgi:hypothetical protein